MILFLNMYLNCFQTCDFKQPMFYFFQAQYNRQAIAIWPLKKQTKKAPSQRDKHPQTFKDCLRLVRLESLTK